MKKVDFFKKGLKSTIFGVTARKRLSRIKKYYCQSENGKILTTFVVGLVLGDSRKGHLDVGKGIPFTTFWGPSRAFLAGLSKRMITLFNRDFCYWGCQSRCSALDFGGGIESTFLGCSSASRLPQKIGSCRRSTLGKRPYLALV